ncbi:hypothetical protein NKG05_27120 [Oerskovia sp. M15]
MVAVAPVDLPSGRRINLDRAGSREVHDWITSSVERWVADFHVDGLRIAQVQDLADASPSTSSSRWPAPPTPRRSRTAGRSPS